MASRCTLTPVLASGTLLMSIPQRLAVTTATIFREATPELRRVLELVNQIDRRHHLLHILFLAAHRSNSSSVFANWLSTLPSKPSHALFYTPEELATMEGTRAHTLTVKTVQLFLDEFSLIKNAFPTVFENIGGEAMLKWAFAMVSSRAWQLTFTDAPDAKKERGEWERWSPSQPLVDRAEWSAPCSDGATDGHVQPHANQGLHRELRGAL